MPTHNIPNYCSMPKVNERQFDRSILPERQRMILLLGKKWVNGTKLTYYFFDSDNDGSPQIWKPRPNSVQIAREGFKRWSDLGIGIQFEEVDSSENAIIRIGFHPHDGSWSYVGRDIVDLNLTKNQRTLNLGWDSIDTAIHEIGHTLGFPHEHQNPNAGIEWDEEAVYRALGGPPNNWDRATTFHNIIRKINPDEIQASTHDANSIMHYPFGPGLIASPAEYRNGIQPSPGLSDRDKEWVTKFYPKEDKRKYIELEEAISESMNIKSGEQKDFIFKPTQSRKYTFGTFGQMDTVMVLFERDGENNIYLAGDDDSGYGFNSKIEHRLSSSKEYLLRIRLYYKFSEGNSAVMVW